MAFLRYVYVCVSLIRPYVGMIAYTSNTRMVFHLYEFAGVALDCPKHWTSFYKLNIRAAFLPNGQVDDFSTASLGQTSCHKIYIRASSFLRGWVNGPWKVVVGWIFCCILCTPAAFLRYEWSYETLNGKFEQSTYHRFYKRVAFLSCEPTCASLNNSGSWISSYKSSIRRVCLPNGKINELSTYLHVWTFFYKYHIRSIFHPCVSSNALSNAMPEQIPYYKQDIYEDLPRNARARVSLKKVELRNSVCKHSICVVFLRYVMNSPWKTHHLNCLRPTPLPAWRCAWSSFPVD